jgi:hypothetical protein
VGGHPYAFGVHPTSLFTAIFILTTTSYLFKAAAASSACPLNIVNVQQKKMIIN